MAFVYNIIDGKRVNAAAAQDYWRLERDFAAVFGIDLIVSDGVRSYEEQSRLYQDYISGRSSVRAANPDSLQAFHVETNPTGPRALDIRDSGEDAGVTRYGNARSAWIRDHAWDYNFNPRGYNEFNEPWHIEWQGTLATDSNGGGSSGGAAFDQDVKNRQQYLNARFGAGLVEDGVLGPNTRAAIAAYQRVLGVTDDGDWGPVTQAAHQAFYDREHATPAPAPTPGRIAEDGQVSKGGETWKAFQLSVGLTGGDVDGDPGPITWSAFQRKVGATVDGVAGPQTIKALQTNVGLTGDDLDGSLGPVTVLALQRFLNAGTAWKVVAVTPEAPVSSFVVVPRVPLYPGAAAGWSVPYGQDNREAGSVIDRYIIHHETAFSTQVPYFKTENSRGSCPTWEVDGAIVTEMIHPALRPSATGKANSRSVASETVNTSGEPDWKVAEASLESHAKIAAWLSQQTKFQAPDGTVYNVKIKLDREHIIGHSEAGVNATACPGPFQLAHLDAIVERAKVLAQTPVPDPVPTPTPTPAPFQVSQADAVALRAEVDLLKAGVDRLFPVA